MAGYLSNQAHFRLEKVFILTVLVCQKLNDEFEASGFQAPYFIKLFYIIFIKF